ncbi:hypothetical protein CDAR_187781 [Caerostris darwini]|uniref:Uncharacterized protein n=1 Tax=Caerostris darwini TaxID=1538125 RepID=A0AAV4N7Y6_9ARAC|nr:hypothetical protein CDAR_187781 [Caerostris darwini]
MLGKGRQPSHVPSDPFPYGPMAYNINNNARLDALNCKCQLLTNYISHLTHQRQKQIFKDVPSEEETVRMIWPQPDHTDIPPAHRCLSVSSAGPKRNLPNRSSVKPGDQWLDVCWLSADVTVADGSK